MDARLHRVQRKAEVLIEPPVTGSELQGLLAGVAADRLALLSRHEAGARSVAHYDFNNTYQYVIAREETHVTWLQNALTEIGAVLPGPGPAIAVPDAPKLGRKAPAPDAFRAILDDDARQLAAFVERWRPRVAGMAHARHRTMLNVVLGESLEHQRLFEQAAAGLEDLLGRRTGGVARRGSVLPVRWME